MKSRSLILSTGLAMFSMFFGSGNLVFPLVVGRDSGGHFGLASLGIILTGVVVPFLGVFAILLFGGSSKAFLSQLGERTAFWFSLFALSLMGPFGVLARCTTVAHGSFCLILPETPLWGFSLFFSVVILVLAVSEKRAVSVLGTVLTPLLLVSLALIAFFGLQHFELPTATLSTGWASLTNGIFQGYQTMDLLAAFYFSSFLIHYLNQQGEYSISVFLKSSAIGAGLLALVYGALVLLGSIYSADLAFVPPQEMLGAIAQNALGLWAAPVVCTAVTLACLTTAVVLASLFADFIRVELFKDKISAPQALAVTLCVAFATSTLEFSGIARILGPILEVTYPALILFTIVSILRKVYVDKAENNQPGIE